ncbi:MAG: hypothetical protein EAZ99_14600 [Alphaproteobacteria bacterium]|nr:MAG: hypothetical protein EAZ99_14600 [Alphaproteobacteria bacterium]
MTTDPALQLAVAAKVQAIGVRRLAKDAGVSPATVSLIARGVYPALADGRAIALLRKHLAPPPIECPVLGAITPERCRQLSTRPSGVPGPTVQALMARCPTCPRRCR